MNDDEIVTAIQPHKNDEKKTTPKKKKSSFLLDVVGGDLFAKQTVTKQLPFVVYAVVLMMLYITNTYIGEDVNRVIMEQNRVLENKHIEYIYNMSEITKLTMQSQLVKKLDKTGIKESVEPLKKITINQ